MKLRPPDVIVCLVTAAVAFALGYFAANHRVTFNGPSAEEPAPAVTPDPKPIVNKKNGWTITTYTMGFGYSYVTTLEAPDGTRWVQFGSETLTPWPAKP